MVLSFHLSSQVLNKDSKASNGSAGANGSAVKNESNRRNRGLSKGVDVTIAYPDGRPLNLVSIATGWDPPCATHVHYR